MHILRRNQATWSCFLTELAFSLNLLTRQLHCLNKTVSPLLRSGLRSEHLDHRYQVCLWQRGSKHIIKRSQAGGKPSQLSGLQNAFALLSFVWVQNKDTQSQCCLWHNGTADLFVFKFPPALHLKSHTTQRSTQ